MKRETWVFLALCREKALTIRELVNEILNDNFKCCLDLVRNKPIRVNLKLVSVFCWVTTHTSLYFTARGSSIWFQTSDRAPFAPFEKATTSRIRHRYYCLRERENPILQCANAWKVKKWCVNAWITTTMGGPFCGICPHTFLNAGRSKKQLKCYFKKCKQKHDSPEEQLLLNRF